MATKTERERFAFLGVGALIPSSSNPRKIADADADKELAESVKAQGILQPLLVRPIPESDKLEVVAGHRRLKAAKAVGLGEVPCYVLALGEGEADEARITENLQRAPVHYLDEAAAFSDLLKRYDGDADKVAHRVGKPKIFVLRRAALSTIVPSIRADLVDSRWEESAALRIARLPEDAQRAVWAHHKKNPFYDVQDIDRFVEQEILRDLSKVPWDIEDPSLVEPAGPCDACPKRSGACGELFPEIKKGDRCLDPVCFQSKLSAHRAIQESKAAAKVQEEALKAADTPKAKKSGINPFPVLRVTDRWPYDSALDVKADKDVLKSGTWWRAGKKCRTRRTAMLFKAKDVKDEGFILTVCVDPRCRGHARTEEDAYAPTPKTEKEVAAARAEKKKLALEQAVRRETLKAIHAAVAAQGTLKEEDSRVVAEQFFDRTYFDGQRLLLKALLPEKEFEGLRKDDWTKEIPKRIEKMKNADWAAFMLGVALAPELHVTQGYSGKAASLLAAAARWKVDVGGIRERCAKEFGKRKEAKPKS